ncbi:MAG: hypothetical protein Q7R70_03935 [Candidatus Diapherotrites archaeon]|nr:hypothetical protein [Candidatus Diapherotrites archaeon]
MKKIFALALILLFPAFAFAFSANCPDTKKDVKIDVLDLVKIAKAINQQSVFFDLTDDERIDIQDLQATANKIGTNCQENQIVVKANSNYRNSSGYAIMPQTLPSGAIVVEKNLFSQKLTAKDIQNASLFVFGDIHIKQINTATASKARTLDASEINLLRSALENGMNLIFTAGSGVTENYNDSSFGTRDILNRLTDKIQYTQAVNFVADGFEIPNYSQFPFMQNVVFDFNGMYNAPGTMNVSSPASCVMNYAGKCMAAFLPKTGNSGFIFVDGGSGNANPELYFDNLIRMSYNQQLRESSQKIYAAVDNAPRWSNDFSNRIDIKGLADDLESLKFNNYQMIITHNEKDWEDLKLLVEELDQRNSRVTVTANLPGFNQNPKRASGIWRWAEPYKDDYKTWFVEIATYSLQHPRLTGIVIDDFTAKRNQWPASSPDRKGFTPAIIQDMVSAGKAINPNLKFYPVAYCNPHFDVLMNSFIRNQPSAEYIDGLTLYASMDLLDNPATVKNCFLGNEKELSRMGKNVIYGIYIVGNSAYQMSINTAKANIDRGFSYPGLGATFYTYPPTASYPGIWPPVEVSQIPELRNYLSGKLAN